MKAETKNAMSQPSYPRRGFASMDTATVKRIASLGGKSCHQRGLAHEWTSQEAQIAGRKGGLRSAQVKRERKAAA